MASTYTLRLEVEGKDKGAKAALEGIKGGLKDAEGAAAGFGEKFKSGLESAGSALTDLGGKLTAGLTLPIIGIGGAAIKMSTDLNAAMANVASLGVPIERVNELKGSVQEIAIRVGKSTDDIAAGLYQVESAFGDTADTTKILETNAMLAAAGLASTEEAIALTSAVTKAYGDTTALAVTHVSDLALKTVALGQTTLPELAGAIGAVTPLSNALGVSQEELFAIMATATGVTGNASAVGTQYRGILQSLMAPTKSVTALMKKQGFANGEAMIAQLGFNGAVTALVKAAEKSGEPLQNYIGSIEGQTLALALVDSLSESYTKNLGAMGAAAGMTDEAFAAQTQGINALGFAFEQGKVKMTVFLQKLGDAIGPVLLRFAQLLEPMGDKLLGLADAFSKMDPETQGWIVGIAGAAAAIGPLLAGVGFLLPMLAPLAGPAGLIALVVAGIAGLIALDAGGIRTGLIAAVSDLGTKLDGLYTAGKRAFDAVGGGINGAVAALGAVTGGVVTYQSSVEITHVDWTTKVGNLDYLYDAESGITWVYWTSKLLGEGSFIYDATAGILSIDWTGKLQEGSRGAFSYDSVTGIKHVFWDEENFHGSYDSTTGITHVDFFEGFYTATYNAGAQVLKESMFWGDWTWKYDAQAGIKETDVFWGGYYGFYSAQADITYVAFGAYTKMYDATADIAETSVLWGGWEYTYKAFARIGTGSVFWGGYTYTYDAKAGITTAQDVLWGGWTYTYDVEARVADNKVLWGLWSYTYDVGAQVLENRIFWGLFAYTYDVGANVTTFTIMGKEPKQFFNDLFAGLTLGFSTASLAGLNKEDPARDVKTTPSWVDKLFGWSNSEPTWVPAIDAAVQSDPSWTDNVKSAIQGFPSWVTGAHDAVQSMPSWPSTARAAIQGSPGWISTLDSVISSRPQWVTDAIAALNGGGLGDSEPLNEVGAPNPPPPSGNSYSGNSVGASSFFSGATPMVNLPQNTRYSQGQPALVGAGGPAIVNHFYNTIHTPIDIEHLAYQVADKMRRKVR